MCIVNPCSPTYFHCGVMVTLLAVKLCKSYVDIVIIPAKGLVANLEGTTQLYNPQ